MKKHIKILPIILSIIIALNSFFNCTFIVYASKDENFGNPYVDAAYWLMEDVSTSLIFLISQLGAIVDHDFVSWCENLDSFDDYWTEDNMTVSEDGAITFSDDLVNYIKQALREYAEETNGFMILPSIHFSTISPSSFGSSYQYQTAKALVNEYGFVGMFYYYGYLNVKDFSGYLDNTAGFYVSVDRSTYYWLNYEDLLKWSSIDKADNSIRMGSNFEKVIHTWDEAMDSASPSDGLYYCSASGSDSSYGTIRIYKPGHAVFDSGSDTKLVSKDGRNILVFKSKAALENYTVEHRSVYFGSKFYEDTGSVSVPYDDFEKWMDGKYDSLIGDFRDIIGDETISEDELEKILDEFLDKFFERWEESGGGSGGGISGAVNEWLEKIYDKLKDIEKVLKKIKNWTILDTLFDAADAIADWLDLIHDIISDVDSGAESAIKTLSSALDDSMGLMKKKFPFSVPWDILFFVTVFSAEPETPYFEVPIDFTVSALGPDNLIEIHYDFVIDFTDYQYLSDIFRTVLSMIYAVGLIKLTSGIVTTNKEE